MLSHLEKNNIQLGKYLSPFRQEEFIELLNENKTNFTMRMASTYPVEEIIKLTKGLQRVNVRFKMFTFPVHAFVFYEKALYFIPGKALDDYLFIAQNKDIPGDEYLFRVVSNLLTSICARIGHQRKILIQDVLPDDSDSFDLVPVEKKYLNQRLELLRKNRQKFILKIKGCVEIDSQSYILTRKMKDRLQPRLQSISERYALQYFLEILGFIQEITRFNSRLSAIHPESFGFDAKNNKLKLIVHSSDEIPDKWKAPEVRAGRCGRFSLIYSFGMLLYSYFLRNKFNESFEIDPQIPEELKRVRPSLFKIISNACSKSCLKRIGIQEIEHELRSLLL